MGKTARIALLAFASALLLAGCPKKETSPVSSLDGFGSTTGNGSLTAPNAGAANKSETAASATPDPVAPPSSALPGPRFDSQPSAGHSSALALAPSAARHGAKRMKRHRRHGRRGARHVAHRHHRRGRHKKHHRA